MYSQMAAIGFELTTFYCRTRDVTYNQYTNTIITRPTIITTTSSLTLDHDVIRIVTNSNKKM